MVPDYQLGLARAMVTLLSEIEAKKVTVIHTKEFDTAATALSMEMDEHTKFIELSQEHFHQQHDMMGGVILLLASNEKREEALKEVIFSSRRVLLNTKFIVYDDGRVDAAVFFMDLQGILDELTSEIQRQIILANFVLLQSVHGSEINTFASMLNSTVFVKTFRQKRAVNFTRAEMKQLNLLRNITNTNLNTFIGMSFNQSNEMMVIWKYCSRKSLDHLIFEKNLRFGRTFQGSFLKHILNGLQYIHSSQIQFHGSLFLSNCVVDAYWVVRLTDFGIQQIIWDKMEHKELESCRSVDIERLPTS
ncbi:hypothetical protein ANCCAN_23951 [Ancylostoma caninum]|uniref:guanylate cyclase n=1 Tax=Ancylostoma caninum TaxID=29170 RepID=A0A368FDM1_ANCCA|nr:hypothetical protein ANCCAN_23951 [Ancylostoma caninum]